MNINTMCFVFIISDLYQITMAYAYWKSEKRSDIAVFDLFFRKNPFKGEFTIFAGLEECLKFLQNFHYSENGKNIVIISGPLSLDQCPLTINTNQNFSFDSNTSDHTGIKTSVSLSFTLLLRASTLFR